jgi:hypothetical protein
VLGWFVSLKKLSTLGWNPECYTLCLSLPRSALRHEIAMGQATQSGLVILGKLIVDKHFNLMRCSGFICTNKIESAVTI